MKQEDLLDAIGDVDEEYIAEAVKKRSSPPLLAPGRNSHLGMRTKSWTS